MELFRVAIPASHIAQSRRFYEALLGVAADDSHAQRLCFHCGAATLILVDWQTAPTGPFRPTPDDISFATDELDAVHVRAATARADRLSPITTGPTGERSFTCLDPDGNRLRFVDNATLP